ncbi:MAG: YidC/Oxa1 family membrane protein insertase [Actinomycetota bacterium]
MIGLGVWQSLLNALGQLVAVIYDAIPNYGVTIIVLTVLIRVVLLPLGIKQIRSMQAMQIIQPEIRRIQTKYKGDRAKQQEATMKLYREHGVNPFSGCWPMLLQFPILISMYSVLRHPQHPPHLPDGSALRTTIEAQLPPEGPTDGTPVPSGTTFLGMNLLCAPNQAGSGTALLKDPAVKDAEGEPIAYPVDCGTDPISRVPYYLFAALMFATTWYQQKQMQAATPQNAASDQQQALLKIMPLMFGVFGFFFPTGLVLYWSTSNLWQIGQQYFMLKNRPTAETLKASSAGKADRKGLMERMAEKAEEQQRLRGQGGESSQGGKGGDAGTEGGGRDGGRGRKKRRKR